MATLTYVYADSTAVLGPLATYAEPHCYDLCDIHSERLTAPRGWEVVRITPDPDSLRPTSDDLEALADAVREAARPRFHQHDMVDMAGMAGTAGMADRAPTVEVARRGHLRMLASTIVEPAEPQSLEPQSTEPQSTEPNWRLGEDGELDELLDDDDIGELDEIGELDSDAREIGADEIGEALDGDDVFAVEGYLDVEVDEPISDTTGRARVLNLPLRSLGDEREPS